jgi:hypothetical protein
MLANEYNMTPTKIILSLIAIFISCILGTSEQIEESRFVFPDSWFSDEGRSSLLDDILMIGASNKQEEISKLGKVIKDPEKELSDPFVTEKVYFVRFETFKPGRMIADYLSHAFTNTGWIVVRDILLVEATNSGGDWLRVYSRGSQQVLVHITGSFEIKKEETPNSLISRQITYKFRGLKPEALLGSDFRKKGQSQRQAGG